MRSRALLIACSPFCPDATSTIAGLDGQGFVERLRGGTYFGHVVEHVALELTDPVGISTYTGKTVESDERGCYLVAVTYKSEAGMKYLLKTAVELVQALVDDVPYDVNHTWMQREKWSLSMSWVRVQRRL
jgi:hypothetical protein